MRMPLGEEECMPIYARRALQDRTACIHSLPTDILSAMKAEMAVGSLQTRTTLFPSFPGFERLRAPMGPISGRVGTLGDGVPEEIAGDKKNSPRPL